MSKTPHKHAEIIKAWADGAEIECRVPGWPWRPSEKPIWHPEYEYRVKPEPVYPKSSLTTEQLVAAYFNRTPTLTDMDVYRDTGNVYMRRVADAAVKQYIIEQQQAATGIKV